MFDYLLEALIASVFIFQVVTLLNTRRMMKAITFQNQEIVKAWRAMNQEYEQNTTALNDFVTLHYPQAEYEDYVYDYRR